MFLLPEVSSLAQSCSPSPQAASSRCGSLQTCTLGFPGAPTLTSQGAEVNGYQGWPRGFSSSWGCPRCPQCRRHTSGWRDANRRLFPMACKASGLEHSGPGGGKIPRAHGYGMPGPGVFVCCDADRRRLESRRLRPLGRAAVRSLMAPPCGRAAVQPRSTASPPPPGRGCAAASSRAPGSILGHAQKVN